jgi:hypothetical protein
MKRKNHNCLKCVHRLTIPGDRHSRCNNVRAEVVGDPYGIKSGWFNWPWNFDPVWLKSCDGFSDNTKDTKKRAEYSPLTELLIMLR